MSFHFPTNNVTSPTLFVQYNEPTSPKATTSFTDQQDDEMITINVGGKVFQALRDTLQRYECYFTAHFRFHETQHFSQPSNNQGSGNFLNVYNNYGGGSLSVSPLSGVTSPIGSVNGATISDQFYSNPSMNFNETLCNGNYHQQQKKKNYIFIDRNPDLFSYVLDCMRMLDKSEMTHCLPCGDMNLLQRLSIEASYFSFTEMLDAIQSLLMRRKKFASVSVGEVTLFVGKWNDMKSYRDIFFWSREIDDTPNEIDLEQGSVNE